MTNVLDARLAGREAGRLDLAADLNPYPARSLEAMTWETERLQAIAERSIANARTIGRLACGRCRWSGFRAELLDGELCPECKLAL